MYFFILIPEWLPHVFLSSFSPINDIFWEINNGISLEFSCINLFSSVFPFLFKLALFSIYFFSQTAEYLLSVKYSFHSSQNFSHNRFLLDVYSSRCNENFQRIVEEYQTLHVNLAHILNVIFILSLSLSLLILLLDFTFIIEVTIYTVLQFHFIVFEPSLGGKSWHFRGDNTKHRELAWCLCCWWFLSRTSKWLLII